MTSRMILAGVLLFAAALAARAGDAGVDAVIRQSADALHTGDMKAAKALLAKRKSLFLTTRRLITGAGATPCKTGLPIAARKPRKMA